MRRIISIGVVVALFLTMLSVALAQGTFTLPQAAASTGGGSFSHTGKGASVRRRALKGPACMMPIVRALR